MSLKRAVLLSSISISLLFSGCGGDDGEGGEGGDGGEAKNGSSGLFCCYAYDDQVCIDFYGPGWTKEEAQDICGDLSSRSIPNGDAFFPDSGSQELITDVECPELNRVGTCEIPLEGDRGIRLRIYKMGSHNHDSQTHMNDCGMGTYTEN